MKPVFRSAAARSPATICVKILRAASTSNSSGALRVRQRGIGALRAPRPRASAPAPATSAISRKIAIAVKHDVAAGGKRGAAALGNRARQRLHRDVVAHQQSLEPDKAANHFAHHCDRSRGRRGGVDGGKHNMGGHAERQAGERPEGGKIGLFQRGAVGIDHRQPVVAVGGGAAVARQMLEHRQNAAGQQALARWRRQSPPPCPARCHRRGRRSPDRRRRPAHRQSAGNRRRCRATPRSSAIKCPAKLRRRKAQGRISVVERAIARARRIGRPMRRAKPLHPAAFLVDQNGRLPADGIAK